MWAENEVLSGHSQRTVCPSHPAAFKWVWPVCATSSKEVYEHLPDISFCKIHPATLLSLATPDLLPLTLSNLASTEPFILMTHLDTLLWFRLALDFGHSCRICLPLYSLQACEEIALPLGLSSICLKESGQSPGMGVGSDPGLTRYMRVRSEVRQISESWKSYVIKARN